MSERRDGESAGLQGPVATVGGISLHVTDPAAYRRALARLGLREFPTLAPLLDVPPGTSAESPSAGHSRAVGYYSVDLLRGLLHKDWQDTDDNENDTLCGYLLANEALQGHEHVSILGSGLGGLVRGVHDGGARVVECFDLSWYALYFSRLMLSNHSELLPPEIRAPLLDFAITEDRRGFQRRDLAVKYQQARFRDDFTMHFGVDSYCVPRRFPGSLLLFCNVAGALRGPHGRSMLLQFLRCQRPNQVLLFLNWLQSDDNTPDEIVELVRKTGGSVTWADLVRLPYSGGGFVARGSRSEFLNFAIRVERTIPFDESDVSVELAGTLRPCRAALESGAPVFLDGENELTLEAVEREMCAHVASRNGCRIGDVVRGCSRWQQRRAEWSLGSLVSRSILELQLRA